MTVTRFGSAQRFLFPVRFYGLDAQNLLRPGLDSYTTFRLLPSTQRHNEPRLTATTGAAAEGGAVKRRTPL